jgi:hypothetical protein
MRLAMEGRVGDLDPTQAPLIFRDVSEEWREIADSLHDLWAGLIVAPNQFLLYNIRVIKQWLKRAGNHELNIIIHSNPNISNRVVRRILSAVMPTSFQWRYLELFLPVRFLPRVLSNRQFRLPLLRGLKVFLTAQPTCVLTAESAPILEHLYLVLQGAFSLNGDSFRLPWPQFSHLDMRTAAGTLDCAWDLFARSTALCGLTISATHNSTIPSIPYDQHRLLRSKLRHLTIHSNTRSGAIGFLLDGLLLPCLEELQIHFTDNADEVNKWPKNEVLSLRRRSVAPLRLFTIRGKVVSQADLIDFVDSARTIEWVVAADRHNNYVTPAVISHLPQTVEQLADKRNAYLVEVQTARLEGRL